MSENYHATCTRLTEDIIDEESISISPQTFIRRKGHGNFTFPSRITILRKVQVMLYLQTFSIR